MAWPWAFVDLDADQKHQRRELLDRYGHIAQISAIVPLFIIQGYFLVAWLQERSRNGSALIPPSSPVRKSLHQGNAGLARLVGSIHKFLWWCGDDVSLFGIQLGTKGEVIGAASWTAWLVLLSILQTGNDYMHLTKRFGIVAASQLPFHYLLAIKTPYSPLQYITRASHETLNVVHQVLGRIVTTLMYLHVIFYINFYIQYGVLASKLKEAYIICGLVAIISFTIIGTSSLAAVRRWSYRTFLAIHVVLAIAVLPILFFHVHHIREYIYETLAVLLVNLVLRGLNAKPYTTANVAVLPDAQLVEVSVSLTSKSAAARWLPGQHAYLSLPNQKIKTAIAKNPFTLSSVPALDNKLRFVARIQSGNTVALANLALSGKSVHHLMIEGPYGVATHADALLSYDRVLMIAGGIGGTFIMPLYRQLLSDLSPSKGSYRRQKASAVWIARSSAEVAWAVPTDDKEGISERLRVYITQSSDAVLQQDADLELYDSAPAPDDEQGIELEERSKLLSKDEQVDIASTGLQQYAGRPDISRLVEQTFSAGTDERVAIIVCGPASLGQAVRREVAPYVYKGRTVWFWNESFAL